MVGISLMNEYNQYHFKETCSGPQCRKFVSRTKCDPYLCYLRIGETPTCYMISSRYFVETHSLETISRATIFVQRLEYILAHSVRIS